VAHKPEPPWSEHARGDRDADDSEVESAQEVAAALDTFSEREPVCATSAPTRVLSGVELAGRTWVLRGAAEGQNAMSGLA
jgi:hypothetical protein